MKKDLSRRQFIQRGSLAALGGAIIDRGPLVSEIRTAVPRRTRGKDEPIVRCGVIGYGEWGRQIAAELSGNDRAELAAVADHFELMLRRAEREVPEAARYTDYHQILDDPEIPAVLIATPTHQHRQIVEDALAAGKNVYCEAPIANTIEDARAIAKAAEAASDQVFQCGLLYRSHPQYRSVFGFIRSGAVGQPAMARGQWRKKVSWRRASATAEREAELNWRLDPALSLGLIGEVGIHQIDTANWFFDVLPVKATGFGGVMLWDDGREVADTIQAVIGYEKNLRMVYDATLTGSFDSQVDEFLGSDSTIVMRDQNAWMFKEVDAPLLGWEVYARKDRFYRETGVALVADATKLAAQGIDPAEVDAYPEGPLYYALEDFLDNNVFGPYPPAASYKTGFEATVSAIRAGEAVASGETVVFADGDLQI